MTDHDQPRPPTPELTEGQLTAVALLECGPGPDAMALLTGRTPDELFSVLAGMGDIAHLLTNELAEQLGIEPRLVVAQVRVIYERALGLRDNQENN